MVFPMPSLVERRQRAEDKSALASLSPRLSVAEACGPHRFRDTGCLLCRRADGVRVDAGGDADVGVPDVAADRREVAVLRRV
jgi:hypothetical protein